VSLKSFISKLDEWLARVADGGLSEEIKEHEKAVRSFAGLEGLLQAIIGDSGRLEIG
jgi:hypothetical protein